jgi:hypothetical protein
MITYDGGGVFMNKVGERAKFFILGLGLGLFCLAGVASDKAKDEAKIYQEGLEAMKGRGYLQVANKMEEWKFELMQAWDEENPIPEVVSKYNRGKVKFSKSEVKEIFAAGGKFQVAVYKKLVEKSWATLGAIDDMGLAAKDAEMQVEKYCVIRVVFKDNMMVHLRIWPKLEQSAISGGTWRRGR